MAYSFDFKDNILYGAEDINAVRSSLMTKGVVGETNDSLKVLKEQEGSIIISEGQAIFEEGCRLAVDSDKVILEYLTGVKNYVYLYNDKLASVCETVVSQTEPTGDYVMLAEISAEGEITDKREFTELKTRDGERFIESFSGELFVADNARDGTVIGSVTLPKINSSLIDISIDFANSALINCKIFPKEKNKIIWRKYNDAHKEQQPIEVSANGRLWDIMVDTNGNQLVFSVVSMSNRGSGEMKKIRIAGMCMR